MSDQLFNLSFISFHSQLHYCCDSSYVGWVVKPGYKDVETDRTAVRSLVEKCTYSRLEENLLSTPIENSSFMDKDSSIVAENAIASRESRLMTI